MAEVSTGSETLVFRRRGRQEFVAVFRDRHTFHRGQESRLRPGLAHLFGPAKGERPAAG